jgi:hypothetical protein
MIPDYQKTSLLISSQLPEHVRGDYNRSGHSLDNPDYENFSLFLQAYYEWMELNGKVTERTKNLLSYKDIDRTTNEFLDYFTNDFLPYFPKDTLVSKQDAIKVARELYKSKGTPASYSFLFRILYNSDFDVFYTKDAVFKASAGQWYITKSLRLRSNDTNFLRTKNLRLFGINSKSIATIENCVLAGDKIEVFISNIERLFESGEFVRVVDSNNQPVLFGGQVLTAKIVGQISQIRIVPTKRGLLYQPGDPVIVSGGLTSNTGIGATAIIGDTTKGSINRIVVVNGGYGYRNKPNTIININNAGGARANVFSVSNYLPPPLIIQNGGLGYRVNDSVKYLGESFATVTSVNTLGSIVTATYTQTVNAIAILNVTATVTSSNANATGAIIRTGENLGNAVSNVSMVPVDIIGFKRNIPIGNTQFNFARFPTANANSKFIDALTFSSFEAYPISSLIVENSGGGINKLPEITATSVYLTDDTFDEFSVRSDLSRLGILGPIQIGKSGFGYRANDVITFTGGQGKGANGKITAVDAAGSIKGVEYTYSNTSSNTYPLGGLGYTNKYLPRLSVVSSNVLASGAELYVPGILGTGAQFSVIADRIGSITSISVVNFGEDYQEKPEISLKIQDIVVSNVSIANLPNKDDVIYQGPNLEQSSYRAKVNNVTLLATDVEPEKSLYNLRVYDYTASPNTSSNLIVLDKNINFVPANSAFPQFEKTYRYQDSFGNPTIFTRNYNQSGVIVYGDGTAKANATFLNGLTIGEGQYLTTQGQPSSFDVLQNEDYNNFTYLITVEKEIAKYREVLLNLLHPSGTKVLGRYALKSKNSLNLQSQQSLLSGQPLRYYLGTNVSDAIEIVTDFTKKSNNIIKFKTTLGTNISDYIFDQFPGPSFISIKTKNGPNIFSEVISVDGVSNTVTIGSNVWLTYSNVAFVTGNNGSNVLNITSLTGSYDIINNGNYSDPEYPIKDIVYQTDKVLVANNTSKIVDRVDSVNGKIYLTTNLSANANSLMSVNRTFLANSSLLYDEIKIFGALGTSYYPELVTQDGRTLTTQAGEIILLG